MMHAPRTATSPADVATEVNGLLAGLGILTVALFPIALPGLLLALPLVLPIAPLVLAPVAVVLLVRLAALPVRLGRTLLRRAVRHPGPGAAREESRSVAA